MTEHGEGDPGHTAEDYYEGYPDSERGKVVVVDVVREQAEDEVVDQAEGKAGTDCIV